MTASKMFAKFPGGALLPFSEIHGKSLVPSKTAVFRDLVNAQVRSGEKFFRLTDAIADNLVVNSAVQHTSELAFKIPSRNVDVVHHIFDIDSGAGVFMDVFESPGEDRVGY